MNILHAARTMKQIVTRLCKKHGVDLSQIGASLRLEMPPYMPLVIERTGQNTVAVRHYYEQNGDLVADPEIVFWIGTDGKWYPSEVTQVPVVIRVGDKGMIVGGGHRRYIETTTDGKLKINARMQADLARFADLWARNIKAQGWLECGVRV